MTTKDKPEYALQAIQNALYQALGSANHIIACHQIPEKGQPVLAEGRAYQRAIASILSHVRTVESRAADYLRMKELMLEEDDYDPGHIPEAVIARWKRRMADLGVAVPNKDRGAK